MFLNYLALAIILAVLVVLFYTFIWLHDLPYDIAKHRNHPQKEAIHAACWLSLFTLHAIWPIVFIWSLTRQGPVGHSHNGNSPHEDAPYGGETTHDTDLVRRVQELEDRLRNLEAREVKTPNETGVV
jgi:hypothetical protein